MAAAVEQENAEILPLDRYIRAVTICNNLALLASQGSVAQFLQRIAVLSRLQRYWTKGFDTIQVSCAEADALPPDSDGDDDGGGLASLVPVSSAGDWEARSDSTVDLKPDISTVVTDVSESANAQLAPNQNDGAEDDGDEDYRPSAKKHTRRVKRFTCQQCGEKFKYRSQLTRHENRSHKQVSDDVATSGTVAAAGEAAPVTSVNVSSSGFADAFPSYSNESVNKAQLNGQQLAAADGDLQKVTFTSPSACRVCGKWFKYASPLVRHERSHWRQPRTAAKGNRRKPSSSSHVCVVCGAGFAFPSLLAMHERRSHAQVDCTAAAARTSSSAAAGGGRSSDQRTCMCSECGRQFSSSSTLAAHVRTHTGERPYVCRVDGCTRSFAQHSTRSYHERTHSDVAPHVCTECGRRFKHAPLLALHARIHTGARPYPCPDCPRAFSTLSRLKVHVRSHSGERPYRCDRCPMSFNSTSGLRRHERAVHLGHRPWRCTVCERTFTVPGNLRTHMRTHTGEKPFACVVCGLRFSHSGTLKGHLLTHQRAGTNNPPVQLVVVASGAADSTAQLRDPQ